MMTAAASQDLRSNAREARPASLVQTVAKAPTNDERRFCYVQNPFG